MDLHFESKCQMDPEIRSACRFCVLSGMRNKDVFDKLQDAYGEVCVSYAWVGKWAKGFREGGTSLADDARSRRPLIPDEVERIRANVECEPY
jgi:transposase